MDEVHSLFLTSGSSSSRFSLDTDSSALDSGLLPPKLQKAWMRYVVIADPGPKPCWLPNCPAPLAELSSVAEKKIKGLNTFCMANQSV